MVFACKKCNKVFRKDILQYEESDEYCPFCDNKYVVDAVTKEDRWIYMLNDVYANCGFLPLNL